ncbi:MAG TPA: phosphodiester glycosidase family protein [Pyrinomonadaceae bacterium]|nr:phosphodiester glycosidase family protein [Pyrinomonadaceae bacterium]
MTQISRQRSITAFFTLAIFAAVFANFAVAQNFKEVYPGVEYARVSRVIDGKNVNFNLLRLDLNKVRLDVVHALDSAIGTETTSSLAKRHNAVAAINAGFFRLDNSIFAGDAAGVLMINHRLLSESSKDRSALFIANTPSETSASFARITIGSSFRVGGKDFTFTGVNRERRADDLIEYTPEFNTTTLAVGKGLEIEVRDGRVRRIFDGSGGSKIPDDGYVISATGKWRVALLKAIRPESRVELFIGVSYYPRANEGFPNELTRAKDRAFSAAEDVTNGVPRLIRDGKIDITWKEEKASKDFVETRHPRTAVANLKDGKFLMLTADGRSEASGGIDLYDLADFLLELGAVDALNLDGGGSTTMVLDGKVVNHPSDKGGERKIGDALIVTLRK